MTDKVKVRVDRAKWLNGRYFIDGVMLDDDGCRCCLGFTAQVLGVSDSAMLGCGAPATVARNGSAKEAQVLGPLLKASVNGFQNTDWAYDAMAWNDSVNLDDATREQGLMDLSAKEASPVEFEFYGEYPRLEEK